MKPQIIIRKYEELFLEAAREVFKTIEQPDKIFNIALSGGKTPKELLTKLVLIYSSRINWQNVRIWWVDERCVPPDHMESNYKLVKDFLLDHIEIPAENIFRIKGELEPFKAVEEYTNLLVTHVPSQKGIPKFDLIILGLGADGHTASIFPDNLDLFFSERFVINTKHSASSQSRISISGGVINNAGKVIMIATGVSKSVIVKTLLSMDESNMNFPAHYVNPSSGDFKLFVDINAASQIEGNF